MNKTTSPTL